MATATIASSSPASPNKEASNTGAAVAASSKDVVDRPTKIDPITALQDGIDGLSLAMFEALRGLRDAVAPESGNLGMAAANPAAQQQQQQQQQEDEVIGEPDTEELWQLYKAGDVEVAAKIAAAVQKSSAAAAAAASTGTGTTSTTTPPRITQREDFIRLHAKLEMEKDAELVRTLAETVLEKAASIDAQVDALPGMDRTREEQMKRIEELIQQNQEASTKLEEIYVVAEARRDACRTFIREKTCEALGIDEEE